MSKARQPSTRQASASAKSRKEALRGSSGVKQRKPPPAAVLEKGRAGTRGVVIYLNPIAKEALSELARAQRKSLQRLGLEAFNHLFLSYGGKPIA